MRYFFLIFALTVALVIIIAGQRGGISRNRPISVIPDMDKQWKQLPQKDAEFFTADGRGSRLPVAGTIARGTPYQDWPANTGRVSGLTNFVELNPLPVTGELLARGRQRYEINCLPCHGAQGDGNGITKKIGAMAIVTSMHDKRIVEMPDGEIFNTITSGKGLMGGYGPNVTPPDRWAIVAYVRALQRAQLGTMEDVPAQNQAALTAPKK